MKDETWERLISTWRELVGPFEDLAIFDRAQASRTGFAALLLRDGTSVGFAKVRDGAQAALANEFRAVEAIVRFGPSAFEVPTAVALDTVEGWHFFLSSALRPSLHTMPTRPPLDEIIVQIQSGLGSLQRPSEVATHWEPMHGDFTPWNLRQRADGSMFLIDWEDAGWAPPGADQVYYRAVESVLTGRPLHDPGLEEAARFWSEILEQRRVDALAAGDSDAGLLDSLLDALGG
jgi:hypothetical protein